MTPLLKWLIFGACAAATGASVSFAQSSRSADVKANRAFVYHGKIVRPDGSVPTGSIPISLKIYSPDPALCLLWAETQTADVKDGGFSVELGHGVNRLPGASGGAAQDFKQAFINNPGLTIASAQCASGSTYTPGTADDRLLSAAFTDNGSVIEIAGLPIKSVPFALQAEEIGGYGLANLVKISGAGSTVVYTPAEVSTLKDLLGGDVFFNMKSRAVKNVLNPTDPQDAATKSWVESHVASSMSGGGLGTVVNVSAAGLPLSVSNGTSTPQISITQANTTTAGYLSAADWNTFNGKQQAGSYLNAVVTTDFVYVGTGAGSTARYLRIGDIHANSGGNPSFLGAAGACSAGTSLEYNSVTDRLECTAYALATNAVATATITDKAVTLAKLQDIATGSLLGRSTAGTGIPEVITVGSGLSLSGGTLTTTGSSGITSVGTITSGTWNGSTIPVAYGGTGTTTGSITAPAGNGLTFAAGSGGNYNVRLTPSGTGYTLLDGNVGIGTSTPDKALTVGSSSWNQISLVDVGSSSMKSTISMRDNAGNGFLDFAINRDPASGTFVDPARPTASITLRSTAGDGNIRFFTSNAANSVAPERMRIDGLGNVGVGTTSSTAKLSVAGSSENYQSTAIRHYRNLADYSGGSSATGTVKITMPQSWTNTMMTAIIKGYNYAGNAGYWEVTISGYNYAVGPSWINTSITTQGKPPFSTFRLAHDGTTNVILLGTTSTTLAWTKILVSDFIASHTGQSGWGSGWSISQITDESAITNVASLTPLTFISGSNVGIGTMSPVSKLEVAGTITATGFSGPMTSSIVGVGAGSSGSPSMAFSGDANTGFYNASSNDTISVAAGGTKIFDLSASGIASPTTGGANITTANGTAANPTYGFAGDAGTGWFRPAASMMAASTGSTERMRIDNNGAVGIGTSSPLASLHMQSVGVSSLRSTSAAASANVIDQYQGANYWRMRFNESGSATAPNAWSLGYNQSVPSMLNVTTAGNVGIGTIDPQRLFEVMSSTNQMRISNSSALFTDFNLQDSANPGVDPQLDISPVGDATSGAVIRLFRNTNTSGAVGLSILRGDNTSAANSYLSANGHSYLSAYTGNVGVGTTSPAAKLDINGAENDGVNSGLIIRSASQSMLLDGNEIDSSVGLYLNNNTPASVILASGGGNVGVGTASPTAPLSVRTTSTTSEDSLQTWTSGAGRGINLLQPNTSDTINNPFVFQTSNSILFRVDAVNALMINGAGNVGIGTTTPGYKLHVVGTAGLSTGTAWTNASDARLKNILGDYEYGLDEVLKLHTVRYRYKKDNALDLPSDFEKTGFIAQEVQKVIPDAVKERADGYLELNVDPIHWAVVNAIKDFYARWFADRTETRRLLEVKDAEIRDLKNENGAIKTYLCEKDPSAPFCQ